MRRALTAVCLLLALPLMAPPASAHLTVTATAPTSDLPTDAATPITVEFSANCAAVLAEYDVESRSPLEIVLNPSSPTWVAGVGEKIPFTFDMCGTDGNVRSSGAIAITPGPMAPGLQQVNISIGAKNANGEAEVGEALVPIRVAYRGILAITPSPPEVTLDNGTAQLELGLNASINADSMLMIEVTQGPEHGTLDMPTSLNIPSALADNRSFRLAQLPVTYTADDPANATADTVTLRILMHASSDPGAITEPQDVTIRFVPRPTTAGDEGPAENDGGNVAGPPFIWIALASIAALVMGRRRR